MPATLYGTFPILLPGKTESVSRNGLKKISGTVAFLAGQESDAESLAEQLGSIFPAPQFRTTDTGVWEMSFEAFEDTGTTSFLHGTEIVNLSKSFEFQDSDSVLRWTIHEVWLVDTFTTFRVVAANPSASVVPQGNFAISKTLRNRQILGERPGSAPFALNIAWNSGIKNITRRNFGSLDELDIVYGLDATVL